MPEHDREMAIDAIDVLNDLIADFVAGTRTLVDYQQRHKAGQFSLEQLIAVQKMCLSHIVLGFAKLSEFWERFHHLVPDKHRDTLKELNRTLQRKDAKNFRNTVAGHIWNTKLGRPLRHSEIMAKLESLTGGHLGDFLRWVNNPEGNTYPKTVLSIVETLRDSLVTIYGVAPDEVVNR